MIKKEKDNKSFQKKLILVYVLTILLGLACFFQIFNLNILKRSIYTGESDLFVDKTQPDSVLKARGIDKEKDYPYIIVKDREIPRRGQIFDTKGNILASDNYIYDIAIQGKNLRVSEKSKKRNARAQDDSLCITEHYSVLRTDTVAIRKEIAKLSVMIYNHFSDRFPEGVEVYRKRIEKAIFKQTRVTILASRRDNFRRHITSKDIQFLEKLPIIGIKQGNGKNTITEYARSYVRIYPYREMARRTIGSIPLVVDGMKSRSYGLELYFDSLLTGTIGAGKSLIIHDIKVPLSKDVISHDGLDVHTTIDLDIQTIVYDCLMDKLLALDAEWGCAVVMEVQTGEIKAIANLGKNNVNGKIFYSEKLNYAFRSKVEPGSTFKLAALISYLDRIDNPESRSYYLCGCGMKKLGVNDVKFKGCSFPGRPEMHPMATPYEIFQRSSNEGIGAMIFDCFKGKFKNYVAALDSMHITLPLYNQFEVVTPHVQRNAKDKTTFYTMCFGGGIEMAPIHTLTYYNAIANNGKMMSPMIVKYLSREDKIVKEYYPTVVKEHICKPSTAQKAKKYLWAVVHDEHGTARGYRNNSVEFAGKTGTRDTRDDVTHEYKSNSNNISFCGFFPYKNPKYSCIVFISDAGIASSAQAAEVFANITNRIVEWEYNSTEKAIVAPVHPPIPYFSIINMQDAENIFHVLHTPFPQKIAKNENYLKYSISNEKPTLVSTSLTFDNELPHVIGMLPSDAVYELSKLNYTVNLQGFGKVKEMKKTGKNSVLLILGPN